MKHLLFEQTESIQMLEKNLEVKKKNLIELQQEYESLNLKEPFTLALLESLLNSPGKAIKDIIKQQIPDKSDIGLKNDKEQILKQITLPDLSKLNGALKKVNKDSVNFFKIEKEKIILNDDYFKNYCDLNYRSFAKNDNESKLHSKFKELENLLNQLNKQTGFLKANDMTGINFNLSELFLFRKGNLELKKEGFRKITQLNNLL